MELGVAITTSQQLFVRTLLHDLPTLDDADEVSMDDGREAVSDDDRRASRHQTVERTLHEALTLRIES